MFRRKSMRFPLVFFVVVAITLAAALPAVGQQAIRPDDGVWPDIALVEVASGFVRPVHVTHAGDGSGRLFVVEQNGRIRVVKDGIVWPAPFLDISERVSCCSERGLLSVAFPPDFALSKQYFYVNYTNADGTTVIARA